MAKAGEEMDPEDKAALNISDEKIKGGIYSQSSLQRGWRCLGAGMVSNLFGAGFGTISITIRWALMLMAKYPEAQEKLFDGCAPSLNCRP